MSLESMTWAVKDAPVATGIERLILIAMGENADADGCNAAISQQEIADLALIADSRTVRDHLVRLEKRGLIARGDQSVVDYLPPGKRPVVWDLMIPYSWFGNADRINAYRAGKGRPPMTPESRPEIAPPPARKPRSDKGVSRKAGLTVRGSAKDPGFTVRGDALSESDMMDGLVVRPDSQSGVQNWTEADEGQGTPDSQSDNPYVLTSSSNNPLPSLTRVTEGKIDSGVSGRGSSEIEEPEVTMPLVVEWFARQLRPDARYAHLANQWPKAWNAAVVEETLNEALRKKLADLVQLAGLLRRMANGDFGETKSPRRLLYPGGSWWNEIKAPVVPKQADGPRCSQPGHVAQPANGCQMCLAAARAESLGDTSQPETSAELIPPAEAVDEYAAQTLQRVRQRRAARVATVTGVAGGDGKDLAAA